MIYCAKFYCAEIIYFIISYFRNIDERLEKAKKLREAYNKNEQEKKIQCFKKNEKKRERVRQKVKVENEKRQKENKKRAKQKFTEEIIRNQHLQNWKKEVEHNIYLLI